MNNLIQRHQRNNEKVKPQSKAQPCEETKKVPLNPLISDKIITIDSEICQKEEESLIKFLRNNKHIFVQSSNELGGTSQGIIKRKLDIDPSFRLEKLKFKKYPKIESKSQKPNCKDFWMLKSSEKYISQLVGKYNHGKEEEWKTVYVYSFR